MRLVAVALVPVFLAGCLTETPPVRAEYDEPGLILLAEKTLVEMETMWPYASGTLREFVTEPIHGAPGNVTYSMQYYMHELPEVYCSSMIHSQDHLKLIRDGFHLTTTQMSCSMYALVDGEKQYYANDFSSDGIGHAWLPGLLPAALVPWGIEIETVQEFRHESGDYSLYLVVEDSVSGDALDPQLGRLHPDQYPPTISINTEDDVLCADGTDTAWVDITFPQLQGTASVGFAPNTPISSQEGTISGTTVTYEAGETLSDRVTLDATLQSPTPSPSTGPCTLGSVFAETQTWAGTTTTWGMTQEHSFDVVLHGTTAALP